MNKYKQLRGEHTQETAAAKTGISVSSARRIESSVMLSKFGVFSARSALYSVPSRLAGHRPEGEAAQRAPRRGWAA